MANGGFIAGYLFTDFTFANDNGLINVNQNGPFTLPAGATGTLDAAATAVKIDVTDDDMLFDDGFQDAPGGTALNQTLTNSVTFTDTNGVTQTFNAGQVLEVEFSITATPVGGGDPIVLLFSAIGASENNTDLFFVTSTSPIMPGVTYDLTNSVDGGGTPYDALVCFASGTLIDTPGGSVAVEDLVAGDDVTLGDGSTARISWAGARTVSEAELALFPQLRPVCVSANALGDGLPKRDLYVSRQHRIVISGARADLIFGQPEVLAPAHAFVNDTTIRPTDMTGSVTYHHFMFDRHQIVIAEGLKTESFFPGDDALSALSDAAREEILHLFPEIETAFPRTARPVARAFEVSAYLKMTG